MRCRPRKTLADILTTGCPDCEGRMLIALAGLVCENGCGRLLDFSTSERQQLRRSFPELVIERDPLSKMKSIRTQPESHRRPFHATVTFRSTPHTGRSGRAAGRHSAAEAAGGFASALLLLLFEGLGGVGKMPRPRPSFKTWASVRFQVWSSIPPAT